MTDEAIKKAEEELKVPSKPPKINRDVAISPSKTDSSDLSAKVSTTELPSKGKENAPVTVNSSENKEPTSVKDVEDKIKARAERFGGFQSEDAKKVARAAR